MKKPCCRQCETTDYVTIGRLRMNSGGYHLRWWCRLCEAYPQPECAGQNIRKHMALDYMRVESVEQLVLIEDRRRERCDVCGQLGAELHHWLPQAYRDSAGLEFNQWPTAWLCVPHHHFWHKHVTPQLWGGGTGNDDNTNEFETATSVGSLLD